MSVFMPILCGFHSSVGQLQIRDDDTFQSAFIIQDCFSNTGFFFSYEIVLSRSVKNCAVVLMGNGLNL